MESAVLESLPAHRLMPSDRPIRVSFMIDDLSRAGTESQLLALIRTLHRCRVEPSLVLLNGTGEESRALEPKDCPILRLGVTRVFGAGGIAAAKRLWSFWHAHRPDVAQIYFLDSAYLGVPVAKLAGVKRVVRVRNNLGYWQTRKHRLYSRLIRPGVDVHLTNSDLGRDALQKLDQLSPERVEVIENGVDLDLFPSPAEGEVPWVRGIVRVGTVANLRAVKNIDGLIRAAKLVIEQYPSVVFEVAGEGEQRPELERLILDLGLTDRFFLRGATSDVPAFLRSVNIAVLPSHSEGMSNAVLEYMAAGKPVVATAVGANADLIEHGVSGLIVPPRDPASLAAAISRLIGGPHMAARFGRAARSRVERDYSRDAMRLRFEHFFHRLAGRG